MTRWNTETNRDEPFDDVERFLAALDALCNEHNVTIAHEDEHGAFIIELGYNPERADWIKAAHVRSKRSEPEAGEDEEA